MTENQLKGIGGWLLLLIIALTILSPGMNIAELAKVSAAELEHPELKSSELWNATQSAIVAGLALETVLKFAAGLMLWRHHRPISPKAAIAALWGAPVLATLVILALVPTESSGDISGGIITGVITSWIGALLWTLYLLKSKRVKITYLQNPVASTNPTLTKY